MLGDDPISLEIRTASSLSSRRWPPEKGFFLFKNSLGSRDRLYIAYNIQHGRTMKTHRPDPTYYSRMLLLGMMALLAPCMEIRAQSSSSSAQNEIDPSLTSNGGGYLEGPYGDLYATIGEPFAADSIGT